MTPADFIRLFIIVVAIIFGYYAITSLVEFIAFLPSRYSVGDSQISFGGLLRVVGFAVASWILIRNNRKLARYIDNQK